MAGAGRDTRVPVAEALRRKGYAFDFFQVVRVLEAMRTGAAPVGRGSDPSQEGIRFRSDLSLSFPASAVVDVVVPEDPEEKAEVVVSFLGVAGSQGPLPRPFTELILDRVASRDTAARDFLDIFNHRLLSLLYRAREKHRVGMRIQPPAESLVAKMAFALMGLGVPGLRDRLRVPDHSLLFYAGALSHGRRTAVGLEGILNHYFREVFSEGQGGAKAWVRVREFVGRWHALEESQATVLGVPGGRCRLGGDAVLGGRVWDQQGMVEVAVGPLDFPTFRRFLPGGDAIAPLGDLVVFYLRDEVDFVIRLVLQADAVPATRLQGGDGAARLGLTSWLKTHPFDRDANEVVLRWPPASPPGHGTACGAGGQA